MAITAILLPFAILLEVKDSSSLLSVNVTRLPKNDKFTNPNQTAVDDCLASGQGSYHLDTCKTFNSTDTRSTCFSSCCERCWCRTSHPTYLAHLGKCVNLSELNSDVFGQGSNGCGPRLDENRNDVCDDEPWTPPVINLQRLYFPEILFCRLDDDDDIALCTVQQARNSGYDQWTNINDFKERFWVLKKSHDFYLQWNRSATSHLAGNVIVINILCGQKRGKPDYPACFVFKSAGTAIVTPPPPQIPTTAVVTTKAKGSMTPSSPVAESSTTPKREETTSTAQTQTEQTSSDVTKITTELRSPGEDKLSDKSRDRSGTTVVIVSVVCTLLAVGALFVTAACFFRKRKRSKDTVDIDQNNIQSTLVEMQNLEQDKPDEPVYQGQSDVYRLLRRDGKPASSEHWEPPSYQGLTKEATQGAWGEGAVYTNPSMYQELKKNETTSNENLPAYHPLVKQQQYATPDNPGYECGYLVLIGEKEKVEKIADTTAENPYYYKLEEHDEVKKTADTTEENPYYYKLEQSIE